MGSGHEKAEGDIDNSPIGEWMGTALISTGNKLFEAGYRINLSRTKVNAHQVNGLHWISFSKPSGL